MISGLLNEGLGILVIGMGTVFVFLALLVVTVSLMSKFAKKLETLFPAPITSSSPAATVGIPAEHIAAITAAVKRYRSTGSS